MAKRIVVAGDMAIDIMTYPIPRHDPSPTDRQNWELFPSHGEKKYPGGASLIATFLDDLRGKAPKARMVATVNSDHVLTSYIHLGLFHRTAKEQENKSKERTWRVKRRGGYRKPDMGLLCGKAKPNDLRQAALLVLDDAGNGFRDCAAAASLAKRAYESDIPILLKVSRPIEEAPGRLLLKTVRELRQKNTSGAPVVLVLDMWDLRSGGMDVSRGLSWERTATDFAAALLLDSRFKDLPGCADCLVVRTGLEGVLLVDARAEKKEKEIQLLFDPVHIEGDLEDEVPGKVVGYGAAFVAGFANQMAFATNPKRFLSPESLRKAAQAGLLAARSLTKPGFGDSDEYGLTAPVSQTVEQQEASTIVDVTADYPKTPAYKSGFAWTYVPVPAAWWKAAPPSWRILNQMSSVKIRRLGLALLRDSKIRVEGVGIPLARFGGLIAFDRFEIEGYRAFRLLMLEYLQTNNPPRPLCVAVFGQPGCGKSFGVNEIAKAVMGAKPEKLTFNLSEFDGVDELKRALHLVHDKSREGVVPLVFFDEFDCTFGGQKLGWLKHLLAPMQDGSFRDAEHEHPIGKAIFVFAGGTSHTFADFIAQGDDKAVDFVANKGPDFVSRLRGHVDVVGPCARTSSDFAAILRRATVFQYNLGEQAKRLAGEGGAPSEVKVCEEVAYALLYTPVIRHGLRSIEALVQMSGLSYIREFVSSALPSRAQLDLHLDAAQFHNMLSAAKLLLKEGNLVAMGRRGHEAYREANWLEISGRKDADTAKQPWSSLKQNAAGSQARDSNFQQVELLPFRVFSNGYQIVPAEHLQAFSSAESFTPRQLTALSQEEHARWVASKANAGWSYAPGRKDDQLRLHPDMVDWDSLTPGEQRKDLDAMARIPGLLRPIGYVMTDIRPPALFPPRSRESAWDGLVGIDREKAEALESSPAYYGYVIIQAENAVLVDHRGVVVRLPGGLIQNDERVDAGVIRLLELNAIKDLEGIPRGTNIGVRLSYVDCEISSGGDRDGTNACSLFFRCELIDNKGVVLNPSDWTQLIKGSSWMPLADMPDLEPCAAAMFKRQTEWKNKKPKYEDKP